MANKIFVNGLNSLKMKINRRDLKSMPTSDREGTHIQSILFSQTSGDHFIKLYIKIMFKKAIYLIPESN